jgi:hypothetical protein
MIQHRCTYAPSQHQQRYLSAPNLGHRYQTHYTCIGFASCKRCWPHCLAMMTHRRAAAYQSNNGIIGIPNQIIVQGIVYVQNLVGFTCGVLILKKKKEITSFGQPTSLVACGRASATLPTVIRLCHTRCQRPPDRHVPIGKPRQRLEQMQHA